MKCPLSRGTFQGHGVTTPHSATARGGEAGHRIRTLRPRRVSEKRPLDKRFLVEAKCRECGRWHVPRLGAARHVVPGARRRTAAAPRARDVSPLSARYTAGATCVQGVAPVLSALMGALCSGVRRAAPPLLRKGPLGLVCRTSVTLGLLTPCVQ